MLIPMPIKRPDLTEAAFWGHRTMTFEGCGYFAFRNQAARSPEAWPASA